MNKLCEYFDIRYGGKKCAIDMNDEDMELLSNLAKNGVKQKLYEYYFNNYESNGEIYCLYNPVYEHRRGKSSFQMGMMF